MDFAFYPFIIYVTFKHMRVCLRAYSFITAYIGIYRASSPTSYFTSLIVKIVKGENRINHIHAGENIFFIQPSGMSVIEDIQDNKFYDTYFT